MPNRSQKTNISVEIYVDTTSRYLNNDVLYYSGPSDKTVLTLSTYKRQPPIISTKDKFTIITAATQYRPDLVSNTAYGVPHFWWKIMEFNGIADVFDFKLGLTIRLPESI
jgi:hypothetical protein